MAKGSSGFGNGDVWKGLPSADDFKPVKPPQLTGGTLEQIREATKNRNTIARKLATYTINYRSDGRLSGLYPIARQGIDAIKKDIQESPLVQGARSQAMKKQKIKDAIDGYKDLAKRMQRYNDIISNNSTSFWLGKKDGSYQEQTWQMEEKLRRKIDGKK